MKTINLKDYYDFITADTYIEISDDIFETFEEHRKLEQAYQSKVYYHKAYYSLDCDDGIESKAVLISYSPEEIFIQNLTKEQLYNAISTLPDIQAKRIYAHYFLGMSKVSIARAEGVAPSSVKDSIYRGLKHLENKLKNIL